MKRKPNTTTNDNQADKDGAPHDTKKQKGGLKNKNDKPLLPCDKLCPKFGSVGIFCNTSDGTPYACVLNQTNIAQNNNKFFVIQVLKDLDLEHYYAWIRWGRVGYHGQTALTDCGKDSEKAVSIFSKKFSDKTKNDWNERHDFFKVAGKYDLVAT